MSRKSKTLHSIRNLGLQKSNYSSLVRSINFSKGDSGSPLVVEQQDSIWSLAGVVSGGVGCGAKQYPGIYVDVSRHLEWILANV